jgi:hypothetical protein
MVVSWVEAQRRCHAQWDERHWDLFCFVTELNRDSDECEMSDERRPASAAMRQSSFDPSPIINNRGANNEIIGCL